MFYEEEEEFSVNYAEDSDRLAYLGEGISETSLFRLGTLNTNRGREHIVQSMRNIFETPVGVRFMVPSFGSKIKEYIFEPNDFVARELLNMEVRRCLDKWEPRIIVDDVRVLYSNDRNSVRIEIEYRIKDGSSHEVFVYNINKDIPEVS